MIWFMLIGLSEQAIAAAIRLELERSQELAKGSGNGSAVTVFWVDCMGVKVFASMQLKVRKGQSMI